MSFQDWLARESLLRRITVLGIALGQLKSQFAEITAASSKTVIDKLADAESDYWRAVEAFREGHFAETGQAAAAAFLQVEFVHELMNSEVAERELGEGQLFELSDSVDEKHDSDRIKLDLKQITVELSHRLDVLRTGSD
jgi:hypothetical protein